MNFPGLHQMRIQYVDDGESVPPRFRNVWLDGVLLKGVTGIDLRMRVDEVPTARIEMMVNVEDVDDVFEVDMRRTYTRDLLNEPISRLDLSVRAYNAIARGIVKKEGGWASAERDENNTIGDVVRAYNNGRLRKYYLMGKKSYDEVCRRLSLYGLIADDPDVTDEAATGRKEEED